MTSHYIYTIPCLLLLFSCIVCFQNGINLQYHAQVQYESNKSVYVFIFHIYRGHDHFATLLMILMILNLVTTTIVWYAHISNESKLKLIILQYAPLLVVVNLKL